MSQIYITPLVTTNNVTQPKYADTDLAGLSWVSMPFGVEPFAILSCDPNPALQAEPDIITFPLELDQPMSQADVASMIPALESNNIPASFIAYTFNPYSGDPLTYRQALKIIAGVAQFLQSYNGQQSQTSIFANATLDDSFASLDQNTQTAIASNMTAVFSRIDAPTLTALRATPIAAAIQATPVLTASAALATPATIAAAQTLQASLSVSKGVGVGIQPPTYAPIATSPLTENSSVRDILYANALLWIPTQIWLSRNGDNFSI